MPILSVTNGLYANSNDIVQIFGERLNCSIITDADIIEKTHQTSKIKKTTLQKVVESKQIAFNDFTHEKEKSIIALKKNIADFVKEGNCIFYGLLGHLIPKEVSHVMRILIIAAKEKRIQNAVANTDLSEKEAIKEIYNADKQAFLWTAALFNKKAWDESLYDIVIPSRKFDAQQATKLVSEHLGKLPFNDEDIIKHEVFNYQLSAHIGSVLSEIGQELLVKSNDGNIVVTIDKKVLMLSKLQQKIIKTVQDIQGVKTVETKIGQNYYKSNIIHHFEFETPLRVLLVDDEKEYVQTLSDRLKLRQFASEIAYNGQEALDFTDQEDTEVILLDLKMPGVEGFDVLKKIKESKPHIEVIILTGHGSEKDRATCMELGAFAYLHKPADIDLITETMKKAYEKIELARNNET
jgi:two-component system, OmpR family, response regulator CpxR